MLLGLYPEFGINNFHTYVSSSAEYLQFSSWFESGQLRYFCFGVFLNTL